MKTQNNLMMMNNGEFEEFYNLPEAIFIEGSGYKKWSIKKHRQQTLRKYNHVRKMRRKYRNEKWTLKDIVMTY